ncbi:hypothetical protein I204_05548 [Kwoniella mangroviensis CBS 8886]|uniref:uncharacterized protein n=1 Tax=Kwoniella mangroviensis CBS 8507 TaxID=1296122 RepID=UPI00080CDEF6|nr:uncharacterized protein I203_07702 [Kwoniella mangroviensis CBS 8507]OCF63277.1 hypothetical protein I203_07702 [Kwoniella mangroviensis CBS 8507]OCF73704.1 hypothetical protein I204_05548 [Kwoniella mangroviensis CBS 8886]
MSEQQSSSRESSKPKASRWSDLVKESKDCDTAFTTSTFTNRVNLIDMARIAAEAGWHTSKKEATSTYDELSSASGLKGTNAH